MSTYLEGPTSTAEKFMYIFLCIVVIAAIACIPLMIADKQNRLDEEWKNNGCQMYDKDKVSDIPAKCNNDFVDHYKSQDSRKQS